MQAKKITDASTIPPKEDLPRLLRWYHAHKPDTGKNESREGLVSAATPQSSPKKSQGLRPFVVSKLRVRRKISAMSKADRLVSHTQRVHQYMT